MKSKFKSSVKLILARLGLLPVAIKLILLFSNVDEISYFWLSLRRFAFNNILTFFPIHWIRIVYLKYCLGVEIGRSSFVSMGTRIEGSVDIGHHSVIGRNCVLSGIVHIGNNVSITAETYIFSATHDYNSPTFDAFTLPVIVEDYAWIGARALIFPGVTIGKGAILGAASSATKDIANWTIAVGSPARVIGTRADNLEYTITYKPYFQ